MNGGLVREIAHCWVANPGNSPAIGCNLRLSLCNFPSQFHSPGIDQSLPSDVRLLCFPLVYEVLS
jgi:hypothetical protein